MRRSGVGCEPSALELQPGTCLNLGGAKTLISPKQKMNRSRHMLDSSLHVLYHQTTCPRKPRHCSGAFRDLLVPTRRCHPTQHGIFNCMTISAEACIVAMIPIYVLYPRRQNCLTIRLNNIPRCQLKTFILRFLVCHSFGRYHENSHSTFSYHLRCLS